VSKYRSTRLRGVQGIDSPFSHHFYSLLILLHRPFAQFHNADLNRSSQTDESPQYPEANELSFLSRKVCLNNAIRVARIFKYHCTRFQGSRQIFITGIDHAATAATALIAGIANIKDPKERATPLRYLRCIADAMKGLASANRAAERMAKLLDNVFKDLNWAHSANASSSNPILMNQEPRQSENATSGSGRGSLKRRWTSSLDDTVPESTVTMQQNTTLAANTNGPFGVGNYPNKRYFRSPSANAGPGFGLDSILPSTWGNYSFLGASTDRMNEMDSLHVTDPLFFDDDFNTIINGTEQASPANGAVDLNHTDFSDGTASSSALLSHHVDDSLNKLDGGPPAQLLDGAVSALWMAQPRHTAHAPRPQVPDWWSRYQNNEAPLYLG